MCDRRRNTACCCTFQNKHRSIWRWSIWCNFTSVSGYRTPMLESLATTQIKAVRADTNNLFVLAGNRATLPGNTCYTVLTAMSIRLAQRAVDLMYWPPHYYEALQWAQRPLGWLSHTRPACLQLWSPWPLSCTVVWTDLLSESTLLAVGPCGWFLAKATASVAF